MSPATTPLVRRRGLFGNALLLSGSHLLRVSEQIPLADPAGISFSAWTKPTDLSGYREIFRKEDGNDRVLFSFQNDGTILSLGLNIGGYVECDAKITPERVRDGRWHHCAATFDGRWMRVYLDGDEIGSLERPGAIRAGGSALGCIGSSNGGECFQGTLDDLRIYAGPLSPLQIAQLYRQGLEVIEQSSEELVRHIRAVYQRGDSFAGTLMQCRQRIVEQRLALDPEYENRLEPYANDAVLVPGGMDYWFRRFPQPTTGTAGGAVPGKGFGQGVTGAAASLVGSLQAFSGALLGDSAAFTSAVTRVTNPPPVPTHSSGRSSGGGSSCACACACAGCACACAGGGR